MVLGQVAEYKTDQDLYHVIQLQKIIENIETASKGSATEAEAADAYIRVRSELEEFRAYLNPDTSDSRKSCPILVNESITDWHRSSHHAVPHCEIVSLPGFLL